MIDPQTIEPNVLIHEMKKSERKKDEIAKEKDDPEKVAQEKSRVKSDLERNYRGFNMPADMDEDQEKDYKAAIDKRKEELAGVEDERAIERGKEALEGVAKSATELPGDIGEVVASVPPVASHLIGSALVAKRKAYEDPTEAIRKAREFGSKVFEGDPEAQEQALIGTSMSMVEPAATAADVELARRDIRKALETRKAGDIATAGVSTVFAGIPVLGVAHFKIMKKSVDDIDEVLPEIAKVSDANRAEVAKYEDFRGKFMAHAADISDRKFSDKELEVLIDPFRSDAVRELSKTNPNIYGDLLDELRRAGVEDDRVADYLDRASAMHQMTKGGDAAGDIAGSLNELRRELKQYNPENLTESRKALDEATKAANDVKSELSAAEAALKRLQQTAPKYVPRSDPGHDEYVAAVREWSRTNRVKERAIKKDIERITGDSYFEYVRPGGSSVKLDILERNLDNARKRVETLEKGPLENDDVRYLIDGLKDKVRGINSPGLDKETRNKIRRIIDDIEAKPGGTPGGGTPGGGAGGGPEIKAGKAADVAKGARAAKLENLTDLKGNTPKLNEDGTITLYHRTTPEAAAEIRRTGKFISKENTDEVFLSSKRTGQAEGYGSEVVEVRVDPDKVRLDDAFDDEIHVAVKTADVAKPPASATMKLPETRQEIDAAFRELGDLQNDRPETAMYDMQRSKASTLWSQTAEHVGDIIRRMTPSGPGEMYRPPEMDIIPKTRRGIADLSGDIEGGIRGQAGTEAKLNELRALGQKYADEHRKLPVYNELQMLANDAAIALGEGRFADSKAALVKLDQIYRENPRKFSDRLEVVEPEFARPGLTAAKPPAATDIATAGAYTPAEIEEAKALWVEKGIESPHFKRWSGGIEPTQIPSESLTPKLSTGDNAGWENYSREALNDKYADAYKRLLAQVPNPDNLKYIDQVAYTPDVLVVHHSTPGMRGTTIDYDAGRSFGFHAGTTEAAQHREYRLARSSRADELANPFEPKPPPHPIGQGRIQPSYDAERVFYFKYNKLLPLPDGYGWGAKSVLLDSIKSAERLNEKKFAADLKKYLDDAELRVRNAGLDWDGSANLRLNEAVEAQSVRDIYKKHGFDGVIYTNIAEDPGSLSIIAIDDSSLKLAADAPDLGKVTGEFKPTGLYGAGAAVPAAAAVRSQREDEL